MTPPLFSIAIPTYNRAQGYMPVALASAVAQSFQDLEILVSDNCSTDDTDAVVASFDDPRIRYVKHETNLGPAGNFKFCIEAAKGHYFLLLHDDDTIDADFVSTCVQAIQGRLDFGMIRVGTRIIDQNGNTLEEHPNRSQGDGVEPFLEDWLSGRSALYMCSTVFNRQALLDVGGFVSRKNLWNDVVAEVRIADRYPRMEIAAVRASFRRHGDNRGNVAERLDWADDSLYLLDVIGEVVKKNRDQLLTTARMYLCRTNYRYIGDMIGSRPERIKLYFKVDRMFGHCCPPFRELFIKRLRTTLGRLKRKILTG